MKTESAALALTMIFGTKPGRPSAGDRRACWWSSKLRQQHDPRVALAVRPVAPRAARRAAPAQQPHRAVAK